MKTLALLSTSDHLQAAEPEFVGGIEALGLRRKASHQETGASNREEGGRLAESVGIRLACSTVVRWYHGGINE